MAHELEGDDTIFSVRQEPWHKLGVVLDNPPNSREAIIKAGLDWSVLEQPLFARHRPEEAVEEVKGYKLLTRDRDGKVLSVQTDSYTPLQNTEAFAFFDPLVEAGEATYETAGSLRGGKRIWVLATLTGAEIEVTPGDLVKPYLLLCNGHDGSLSIHVQATPIRVVCANTLRASLGRGDSIRIPHLGDYSKRFDQAKAIIGVARKTFESTGEMFRRFLNEPLNSQEIGDFFRELVPDPILMRGRLPEIAQAKRAKLAELHEAGRGANIPGVRGTVWGAYNAATEFADFFLGQRTKDRANFVLFSEGRRFKDRAFELASQIVGAN